MGKGTIYRAPTVIRMLIVFGNSALALAFDRYSGFESGAFSIPSACACALRHLATRSETSAS